MSLPHSDAALEEKGADLIDDARASADQPLTHAVSLQVKLRGGLGGNELHRRPLDRLGNRFRIAEVVLLAFRVGANILCWHEPGVAPKCLELYGWEPVTGRTLCKTMHLDLRPGVVTLV